MQSKAERAHGERQLEAKVRASALCGSDPKSEALSQFHIHHSLYITYLDFVLHVGTGSSYPGRPLNTTFAFLFFGFFVRDARLAKSARTRISETAIPRGIAFPFQGLDITSIFQYINCGRLHICRERYRCDRTNTRRRHFSSPVLPDLETPFPVYR